MAELESIIEQALDEARRRSARLARVTVAGMGTTEAILAYARRLLAMRDLDVEVEHRHGPGELRLAALEIVRHDSTDKA